MSVHFLENQSTARDSCQTTFISINLLYIIQMLLFLEQLLKMIMLTMLINSILKAYKLQIISTNIFLNCVTIFIFIVILCLVFLVLISFDYFRRILTYPLLKFGSPPMFFWLITFPSWCLLVKSLCYILFENYYFLFSIINFL